MPGRHRLEPTLRAYGESISLSLPDAEMLKHVTGGLPRAWTVEAGAPAATRDGIASFTVLREPSGYVIQDDVGAQTRVADGAVAAGMLRTMLRRAVGARLRDLTCIEAGVVRYQGRAIILPARALGGTSTLLRALVAAGAELHSEELALITGDGMLVSDLDAGSEAAAQQAVPAGLVALTDYRPGCDWAPRRMSQAEGVAALMAFVLGARERPRETLAALRLALAEAIVLQGDRGEAEEVAAAMLDAAARAIAE